MNGNFFSGKKWQFAVGILMLAMSPVFAVSYYVSPDAGNDRAKGTAEMPWKSFSPLKGRVLKSGDRVVVAPGTMSGSLALENVKGSATAPVVIEFQKGEYIWDAPTLMTRKLHISNTNDAPFDDKRIAIELKNCKHVVIQGKETLFLCKGKMMEMHIDHSSHIKVDRVAFDYLRPTVSEVTVLSANDQEATVSVNKDSRYRLDDQKHVVWVGDYWEAPLGGAQSLVQRVLPNPMHVRGGGSGVDIRCFEAEELRPGILKLKYDKNPGLREGETHQHREIRRDYCAVFNEYSRNVSFTNTAFHFMHGMGVVSQFSKDISFNKVRIAPRVETKRTCAAWADMLHFSGCSGKISVKNVFFSGSNDDAINVHGTHLRIVEMKDPRHITVRFMHHQTWGFPAFAAGDEVDFINSNTLNSIGNNRVKEAVLSNDGKTMELTLEADAPSDVRIGEDVLENATASPEVYVSKCKVQMVPTRGFLLTSRKKMVISDCVFERTGMPGILVADDARSWYESCMVRDLTIRNCTFTNCGEPVIKIEPENNVAQAPVHTGIKILNNRFNLNGKSGILLKSASDVQIKGNVFDKPGKAQDYTVQRNTSDVKFE